MDAPALRYIQKGAGTCGISAFSSALYYMFDQNLSTIIINQKDGYIKSLSEPSNVKSKKASSMKFLINTINNKKFSKYYVERKKKLLSWKEINKCAKCYKSIILGIVKSNLLSRDHIIAICNGWIFDANLPYAIPLTLDNLNWCAGHGNKEVLFDGFFEQVEIGYKDPDHVSKKRKK